MEVDGLEPLARPELCLVPDVIIGITHIDNSLNPKKLFLTHLEDEVKAQAGTGFAPWLAKYAAQVNEDGVS